MTIRTTNELLSSIPSSLPDLSSRESNASRRHWRRKRHESVFPLFSREQASPTWHTYPRDQPARCNVIKGGLASDRRVFLAASCTSRATLVIIVASGCARSYLPIRFALRSSDQSRQCRERAIGNSASPVSPRSTKVVTQGGKCTQLLILVDRPWSHLRAHLGT